ncbi:flagellar hook-basal body complex protein FliE [Sporobacter termitidis DSM 10068]|uniref:Flagellar hook-basal body complex protein FliE n=1 Tax=Sporobacter termitidis DSM 10068 TaxID=1123282 RepID=A0A1M5W7E6_9FIRM|nr:flagellar hook-basal body complex protein FliE [Sporobacter termitidis]SHH83509.1 flagellar hook-basal body complex protein FliE [Sporobacter termitidis DSM 10068]
MPVIGSNPVSNLSSIVNAAAAKSSETGSSGGFKEALNEALEKFNKVGDDNAQATLDLLTGNTDDLSDTMIAAQKSEITLNLTVAIRNKAVEAYKEIMNMQV